MYICFVFYATFSLSTCFNLAPTTTAPPAHSTEPPPAPTGELVSLLERAKYLV